MNPWWGSPDEGKDDPEHGADAWFDLWTEDDGTVVSYFGRHDAELPLAALKAAMRGCLEDLVSGRTKRVPHSRNLATEIAVMAGEMLGEPA